MSRLSTSPFPLPAATPPEQAQAAPRRAPVAPVAPEHSYRLTAATALHQGDREYQQDQVALLTHPRVNGCVLGVVADGMGGRTGGRQASDQVQLTARQLFEHYQPGVDRAAALLQQIAHEAHTLIQLTAVTAEQDPHSTFAAFLIHPGGECFWAHAGDTRIYHFRGNALVHRTLDHSYVQMLVDQGELTEEEARWHPRSNVLTGCLGTERDPVVEQHHIPRLHIGDTLLACTDGLWHYFRSVELGEIVSALSPREASQALVHLARERARGGGDNLALAIVRLEAPAPGKTAVGSGFMALR